MFTMLDQSKRVGGGARKVRRVCCRGLLAGCHVSCFLGPRARPPARFGMTHPPNKLPLLFTLAGVISGGGTPTSTLGLDVLDMHLLLAFFAPTTSAQHRLRRNLTLRTT